MEKSTAVSAPAAGKPKLSYLCSSRAGKRERAGGIVGQRDGCAESVAKERVQAKKRKKEKSNKVTHMLWGAHLARHVEQQKWPREKPIVKKGWMYQGAYGAP